MNLIHFRTTRKALVFASMLVMLSACGDDDTEVIIVEVPVETPIETPVETPVETVPEEVVLEYIGTEKCLACHSDKKSFLETGHNMMLTEVVNDEEPLYPFTSVSGAADVIEGLLNTLGDPDGWKDIKYVLGGTITANLFIDKNGYIMNGQKAGMMLKPKGTQITSEMMMPYIRSTEPDGHPYGPCGRCHTTGWKAYTSASGDERNLFRQDDMPGMTGTFAMTGIQCESCHGAGSEHIKGPSKHNIVKIADARIAEDFLAEDMANGKAVSCIECHTTEDARRLYPDYVTEYEHAFGEGTMNSRLPVVGEFGQPEGRKDDVSGGGRHAAATLKRVDPNTGVAMGKKASFNCSTCHNPHQSAVNHDKAGHENAMVRQCTDCHTKGFADVQGSDIASAAHEFIATCTDCHMPTESHLFKIDLEGAKDDPRHFSADGEFQMPWLRAWDSCSGCHEEDYDIRALKIGKIHNDVGF